MPIDPKDYMPGVEQIHQTFMELTGKPGKPQRILIESGGLTCQKCGKEIPVKEMFCLHCFAEKQPKKKMYHPPKPDEPGGLFDGIGSVGIKKIEGFD